MNKKIFIGAGIIVFLLIAVGGYFFWKLSSESTPTEPTLLPPKETTTEQPANPTGTTVKNQETPTQTQKPGDISIQTKDGGTLFVNDFLKSPKTTIDEEGDATLKDDPNYTILYYKMDQSVFIGLLGGNLPQVRSDAEKELLNILGITEQDACQLKVSTTVPASVSEKAAGKDYGLSFCPSGKPLPKDL
jgi:hypothetical protein